MRVAVVQLNVGEDPAENLGPTLALIREAVAGGAEFVLTPECTNMMSSHRATQRGHARTEADDPTLAALRGAARDHGIWLLVGSLCLLAEDGDGRMANRSFLIGPDGAIAASYDKIHMFDVNVSETEVFRESAAYRPGDRAVLAQTDFGAVGMTICYDLRFGHLHRALAQAGARILAVPAAFNHITGQAHWEVLLRARAIETGCWVLAPAQTGPPPEADGRAGRRTWGHSLVIAPWGEVVADGGAEPGVTLADIDLAAVDVARHRIPSLTHDRDYRLSDGR